MTDPDAGPDPVDLEGARRQWRHRQFGFAAFSLAAAGVLVVSLVWWDAQRAANDRLLDEGELVTATVTEVRVGRGPDTLIVEFVHEGDRYERRIHTGFFGGYARSNRGRDIGVLFDPARPDLVRTPSGRNMHDWTWLALTAPAFALWLALREFRRTRIARRLLRRDDWQAGRLSVERPERRRPGRLELIDDTGRTVRFGRHASGSVGADHFRTAAHHVSDERWTVMVPARTRKATLGRRSGR
ncbi:MAG: hypothetical protein AAF480_17700 [Actinomycetota bacterium]